MTSNYDFDLHFNSAVNLKTGFMFKMGDKGMTFNLHIKDLDPLGMTGKIVFHRSNNTSVESALVGSGSEYTYTILGNEFAVPGVVICDVKFYDEPSQRISTTSFVLGVISDTLDGLGSGTAGYSDELEVLRLAMEQAEQDLQDMEQEFADTLQDYKDAFGNTAPINPRGVYDPTEEYNPRDAVEYTSGSKTLTYICKETCTGELPTNTYYWQVMIDVAVGGSLAALSDVDIPTPADGEVLAYNSTTQKWESEALPTPVDNLTSTSTTDALSAKQGKVLKDLVDDNFSGQGNENLIDNPWFTVNQRGVTSGGFDVSYKMDRWETFYTSNVSGTWSLNSNGLSIDTTNVSSGNNYFAQAFSASLDASKLYTASVMLSDGTVLSDVITSFPASLAVPFGSLYITATGITITIGAGTTVIIRAVKLEVGSKSTLAHDVEPNYTTELLKCRRYFKLLYHDAWFIGIGAAMASDTIELYLTDDIPMRAAATAAFTGSIDAVDLTDGTVITISSVEYQTDSQNKNGRLLLKTASTLTIRHLFAVRLNNARITLSADL